MARYIDADKLIEYIDKNVICTSRDSEECKQFMLEHLEMEFFAPTADVVPKSEYGEVLENWQKIHDSYTTDCIYHYNKGRQDVAREIFEEIEKFCRPPMPECQTLYIIRESEMEELKSKYLEDM